MTEGSRGVGITRFAARGTTRLSYEDRGPLEGPVAVLLHDLLADRSHLRPLAETLDDAGWRVLMLDARGHGASAALGTRPYPPTELAADVLTVMDHAVVTRAHLIGDGWGGSIAIGVSRMAAPRVASMVLIQPDLPGVLASDDDPRARWAWQVARDRLSSAGTAATKGLTDRAIGMVLEARRGADWETALERGDRTAIRRNAPCLAAILTGAIGNEPSGDVLSALAVSTLVISGTSASESDQLVAQRLIEMLPEASAMMADTSVEHPLPSPNRPPVMSAIIGFLSDRISAN